MLSNMLKVKVRSRQAPLLDYSPSLISNAANTSGPNATKPASACGRCANRLMAGDSRKGGEMAQNKRAKRQNVKHM